MKKYLAFALALIMALALIPGSALADKGWDDKLNHDYNTPTPTAPIPQPVYVEYDYGEILNMFPGDTKLAELFNNSAVWTTVASDNAYGSGEGNFVPETKFAYNYSEVSDIQDWKHTTNSISLTAMAAVTPKKVNFLGWEVT